MTLEALVREFIVYWTTSPLRSQGGCGMCGGLSHSSSCYVGRMSALLAAQPSPEAAPLAPAEKDRREP